VTITSTDGIRPVGGCALANLQAGEDPVGTATPFDDLLLLRWRGPWARVAASTPGLPVGLRTPLADATRRGRRVHALLIDADDVLDAPEGSVRLEHVRRPVGPARRFLRSAWHVPLERLEGVADALLHGAVPDASERLSQASRALLVCTHGERDGCCGRFGEAAYQHLARRHAGPDLAVWRVSHIGGHRFAPTLVELPEGRVWGRLTAESLSALAERTLTSDRIPPHYRGWSALPADAQAAERDLFVEHGAVWRDAEVEVDLGEPGPEGERALEARYRLPGGDPDVRHATVRPGPSVRVPASCGATPRAVRSQRVHW
jgi:hypothetical protein